MVNEAETVVITGGTAGVGRAVVREFAKRKANIAILARDQDRLASAAAEVERAGGQALPLSVDVSDSHAVQAAADQVVEKFGALDIWVNNAMTTIFAPISETKADEFKRATEVTYLGTVYGTMAALKHMLPRNRGTILQVGSALAYRSIPLQAAYCGAKHGIVGFTDSLRCELIHHKSKIHITMVHLPAMNTPQFSWCRTRLSRQPQPVPPIYQPEVAARAIYWAAHHKRRETFVGFPTVKAIYGQDVVPGIADWYLGRTGVDAQQAAEPVPADRPDNLFEPVRGDYAAHGIFNSQATDSSLQNWANLHRAPLAFSVAALAGLGAWLWKRNT